MVEVKVNSAKVTIKGTSFDFIGYIAELGFDGDIKKVIEITTGSDVTKEFRKKYEQALKGEA
ncbi:hypothetical protein [Acinetobacter sp. NIPH 817]|uniref:hypothetical protein n=1 Tax=Acinetobacter sp. NIPH 817 TaxID=520708 RepID=UPI0002CFF068|nr:hypothetical protein [Acinetobacter sp. NIPH 817]ENV02423.1 hypothetical protein F968_02479 [Acinetobacter sp. NIPH 817]